jgi:23S rRNA pseudouridine2605 synthase
MNNRTRPGAASSFGAGDLQRRRLLDAPGARSSEKREGQRIAKVMARAGLCSRRDAEAWIAEGRVVVNGKTLDSPAFNVTPEDDVRVDGKPLAAPERTRLFLYNKPRGLATTARDPEGRPTIFEQLPQDLPRVVAVGRLDINTEGLMLLTNDGGLARVLELPATGWLRRYRVRAHGEIAQALLDPLREGVTIDGVDYAGIEAALDRTQGSNVWMTMGLREGKNREIKKVLEHLGLAVNRLIRISFGPFQLGDLEEGAVEEVRTRVLRDQLGPKLAREAGADFDAPRLAPGEPAPAPREEARAPRPPARAGRKPRPGGFGPREERRERDSGASYGPPKTSYGPKMRKHVTTLRAQKKEDESGPRRRIARGAAVDRKGREIKVERLLPTIEEARRRAAAAARRDARPPRDNDRGDSKSGAPGPGRGPRARDDSRPFHKRSPGGPRSRRDAGAGEGGKFGGSGRGPGASGGASGDSGRGDGKFVAAGRSPRARDDSRPFRKGPPDAPRSRRDVGPGEGAKPFRTGPRTAGGASTGADGGDVRGGGKSGASGRTPRARDDSRPFRKGPPGGPRSGRDAAPAEGGKPFRKGPRAPRGGSGGKRGDGPRRPPRR